MTLLQLARASKVSTMMSAVAQIAAPFSVIMVAIAQVMVCAQIVRLGGKALLVAQFLL